jgi:hypothetical protein
LEGESSDPSESLNCNLCSHIDLLKKKSVSVSVSVSVSH